MKNKVTLTLALMLAGIAQAQVGFNTSVPKATLDVVAKSTSGETPEGLLVPRVDRLKAQTMTGVTASTMIYVNSIANGSTGGAAVNINAVGYYYFDGTVWVKINTGISPDTNIYNTNGNLLGNRIVTQGANTLAFNSTATTGTNHFSVDGSTFSVDAVGNRVGIGTTTPKNILDLGAGNGKKLAIWNNAAGDDFYGLGNAINVLRLFAGAVTDGKALMTLTKNGRVGIGTENPQSAFHLDGNKDNNATGVPTATQQANDVVITPAGSMGIGVTTPVTRLDINNGTTNGAIKIVDGTQGASKVLMSDENGVGTWRMPASIKATATGVFPASRQIIISDGTAAPLYAGMYIDLTHGKWVVNTGLTMYNKSLNSRYWLHAYLSSSQTSVNFTGFRHLGPSGVNTSYAGVLTNGGNLITNDSMLNFLSGSSVIEVTAPTTRIYVLIENKSAGFWEYITNSWENYFYAIPIN